jgi:hypothetical protein
MLSLKGKGFTTGCARFRDQSPGAPELTAKIFIKIEFQDLDGSWLAQLDTGAAYSMLEPGVARALNVLDGDGQPVSVHTREGTIEGRLERIPLTLIADEGRSLDLDAVFFVSREWPGKTFLGYTGFLDRLRIALDSPVNLFYFGESE